MGSKTAKLKDPLLGLLSVTFIGGSKPGSKSPRLKVEGKTIRLCNGVWNYSDDDFHDSKFTANITLNNEKLKFELYCYANETKICIFRLGYGGAVDIEAWVC